MSAVESQLVSDVPVGCFLSGGIDSSLVTALASRKLDELRTFTVGFAEPESDERRYADRVARLFSTRHVEHFVGRTNLERELSELQEAFDEPFDPNGPLPFMHVARLARTNDTKVVLGGDGADELFVGYLRYDDFDRPRSFHGLPARLRMRLRQSGLLAPRKASDGDTERYFHYEGCLTRDLQRHILADPFADPDDGGHTRLIRQFEQRDVPAVAFAQLTDMNHYLVDHVLCKVDRASMAYGVETRVPFLSQGLVELAFSIPLEIHYRRGERKSLLKEVALQFLPADVVTSRKKGFSSPLHAWADAAFQAWADQQLVGGRLVELGVLRSDWSRGLGELRARQPGSAARMQWLLITAELWARRWLTA
jgi:asparagine synthase (glutamine-hydrolysing)